MQRNGFAFGRSAVAAHAGQGIVGDTHVSRLIRKVSVQGETPPEGYQFYVYPYFESTGTTQFKRTREACARAILEYFRSVSVYAEGASGTAARRGAALFVLPIADQSALERLAKLERLDVSEAGRAVVDVYDYSWAQDQIAQALHDKAPADTRLKPVSLVISREPLDGRRQTAMMYVVPIEHADTAGATITRVDRALRSETAVLPTQDDLLTRLIDSVGAVALVTFDTVVPE